MSRPEHNGLDREHHQVVDVALVAGRGDAAELRLASFSSLATVIAMQDGEPDPLDHSAPNVCRDF